jgi:magnesium chelatase family protein
LLPPLDDEQSLEASAVHSVAGVLDEGTLLVTLPPFVDPHHSASLAAVVGGGTAQIRPGAGLAVRVIPRVRRSCRSAGRRDQCCG